MFLIEAFINIDWKNFLLAALIATVTQITTLACVDKGRKHAVGYIVYTVTLLAACAALYGAK